MAAPAYSVLELCRNRAGHEAVPERPLKLDLPGVAARLKAEGFEVLADAGIILVLRWGAVELSVFESGKLLFKTRDEAAAASAMRAFREAMGWA